MQLSASRLTEPCNPSIACNNNNHHEHSRTFTVTAPFMTKTSHSSSYTCHSLFAPRSSHLPPSAFQALSAIRYPLSYLHISHKPVPRKKRGRRTPLILPYPALSCSVLSCVLFDRPSNVHSFTRTRHDHDTTRPDKTRAWTMSLH